MKVGILTLPLHTNYGGILQAYALQTVIKRMGHDVWFINRQNNKIILWRFPLSIIKRCFLKLIFKKDIIIFSEYKQKKDYKVISQHTETFIDKYIAPKTQIFRSSKSLKTLNKYCFDAIIVGSDQIWRPKYTPSIEDYYLKFVKSHNIKKIAYAASFGTEEWEYTKKETRKCKNLISDFDSISVREESGIVFCNKYFNLNVTHVIDPIFLLDKNSYTEFIKDLETSETNKDIFVYLLDETEDKNNVIKQIESEYGSEAFRFNTNAECLNTPLKERIAPPVEKWIAGFKNAKFVFTDSFHGCIFSILFNVPFLVYGNETRGMNRFVSLLKKLTLLDRLISSSKELISELVFTPINWDNVNKIIGYEKVSSKEFLNKALSK